MSRSEIGIGAKIVLHDALVATKKVTHPDTYTEKNPCMMMMLALILSVIEKIGIDENLKKPTNVLVLSRTH
jgi:hypothetical protein